MSKANIKTKENIEKFRLSNAKSIKEASEILPQVTTSKFVGSVDIDVVLNLKEKQKKESIRGSISLPHSLGESKTVVAICEEKDEKAAIAAGAVAAGLAQIVEKIEKGWSDFDVVVATPEVMPKIVKLGKILGPKGLMPNPRTGTVTTNIPETVQSYKAGKTDFKMIVGQTVIRNKVAKTNMSPTEIEENIIAYLKSVFNEVKRLNGSNPFKKVTVAPTMGPGVKVDINDIIAKI
jgi:large subunit ribosomal protein L1